MTAVDKREVIADCLRDRHTSADAILNALHQAGWRVTPRSSVTQESGLINPPFSEQQFENDQVRRLQIEGRCPVCGAEDGDG